MVEIGKGKVRNSEKKSKNDREWYRERENGSKRT